MNQALVENVPAEVLHAEISKLGLTHVLIVPDTHQKTLLSSLDEDKSFRMLTFSTEDEAICANAGLWMGGAEPFLIIQNVGVFAAMNAIRGVSLDLGVPTCMLVGQYGRDVTVPVPENESSGVRMIEALLKTMDIPCYVIDRADQASFIPKAFAQSRAERRPTVVLVSAPTA